MLKFNATVTTTYYFSLNKSFIPYASVNSSSAHPPRADPRALAFFKKNWQIPWGGDK